jgi:hypothetical protein
MPNSPQSRHETRRLSSKPESPRQSSGKGDHVFLAVPPTFSAPTALPPLNRKSDGLQVNAVLGFCNISLEAAPRYAGG